MEIKGFIFILKVIGLGEIKGFIFILKVIGLGGWGG